MYFHGKYVKFKGYDNEIVVGLVKGHIGNIYCDKIKDNRSPFTCFALIVEVPGVGNYEYYLVDSLKVEEIN